MIRDYAEVKSQQDLDVMLSRVAEFHDSMTKEFRVLNRGHVNPDHSMTMSHRFDLQLLIQSQWKPYGIELLMIGVSRLETTKSYEYWGATGVVREITSPVERTEIELRFDASLTVVAERLFTRDRPDWLGAQSFLGPEIPLPDCVQSTPIDDQWRQCSACAEAFSASTDVEYARCPGCGQLTTLEPAKGDGDAG